MFDVYAHLRTKCEILTRNSAEILENASLLPFISMLIGEKVVAITVFLKTTTISAQSINPSSDKTFSDIFVKRFDA